MRRGNQHLVCLPDSRPLSIRGMIRSTAFVPGRDLDGVSAPLILMGARVPMLGKDDPRYSGPASDTTPPTELCRRPVDPK